MKVRFQITEDEPDRLSRLRLRDRARRTRPPAATTTRTRRVLVYKIQSHFDIKREYNPGTGEETNVISENEKDRPWNQRQYMRVDWSQNLADPPRPRSDASQQLLGVASDLEHRHRDQRGGQSADQPGPADLARATTSSGRTSRAARPISRPATTCSAPTTRSGRGAAATPRSPTATRCCRFPTRSTSRSRIPDRQVICQTPTGTPIRMAFGSDGIIPCNAESLKARGARRGDDCTEAALDQFAKFGFFRTALPDLRPAGRRDRRRDASTTRTAGTSGRRRSRRARTASRWSARTATPFASPSRAQDADDHLLHEPGVPGRPDAARHGRARPSRTGTRR